MWLLQLAEIHLLVQVLFPIIQRFICIFAIHLEVFYFLDNSIVTTVRGRGIRTLFLLIMESGICHWAANLLAVIMKVILLSMISILPTCLYLIFIWSSGFFFLVSCDMCCQFGICWWLIFLNLGHISWSTQLPNYKSLNCIGWDVNCIKLIYCICSL